LCELRFVAVTDVSVIEVQRVRLLCAQTGDVEAIHAVVLDEIVKSAHVSWVTKRFQLPLVFYVVVCIISDKYDAHV
jgi:hypothetical protein